MTFRCSRLLIALVLWVAGAPRAHPQVSPDLTCHYTNPPGASVESALPGRNHARLIRSRDSSEVESACSAIVSDRQGAVVWTASGYGTTVSDGTGRDLDGDGTGEAVIGVDTGGGNRCCWTYFVLTFSPRFQVAAELTFAPFFGSDATGRALVFQIVPFYDLGPSMAESPTIVRAHQFRSGRLQDVTTERCDAILSDTTRGWSTRQWDWDLASPARRAASRRANQVTYEIERTRGAVTSLVLQLFVCGRPQDAARLAQDTWPADQAGPYLEQLRVRAETASKSPSNNRRP